MGQGNNDTSWRQSNRESQIETQKRETELIKAGYSKEEAGAIILFEFQNRTIPSITKDNGDLIDPKNLRYDFGDREVVRVTGRNQTNHYSTPIIGFKDPITGAVYDLDGNFVRKEEGTGVLGSDLAKATKDRLKKYGKRKQGGILRYPAESITQHADYLQIDIERYAEIGKSSYVSDTGGSSRYVIGTRKQNRAGMTSGVSLTRRPLINDGTILLPIPSNVSDANNVSYGESRLNGLAAAGISAAGNLGEKAFDKLLGGESFDLKTEVTNTGEKLGNKIVTMMGGDGSTAAITAADVITKQLTASAVNIFDANVTANQLLARSNGEIINPNLEILFSDVTLRNFAFRYKLTPRNKYEAEQVKLIIRAFKRNMAPQAIGSDGASDFFLRSPNVFKLRYRSGNKDHPFLNKFKQCFLSDMQTKYTGEGIYSTYDDGTPVSIELSLSFKEIQPIYDIDYDEFPGTRAVGY